ncbi:hypothetical protein Clacol_004404 [Clathrus columnatus]|uniref:Uncharacterized protein n=1 Tax=Clathrus columnatus TaxID=1419009 RepID=A0AAV5AAG4_9AGAM|nr:hypothetical protein Clacol_004404 [Clathrus columnatus]
MVETIQTEDSPAIGKMDNSTMISEELVQSVSGETIAIETFIAAFVHFITVLLVINIATILLDVLAFLAILYQVWGLWKEKQRLHLHTDKDFVTLLLQQGVLKLRFSYCQIIGVDVAAFQRVLSVILICEFTLALRRRNATRALPTQSALELPDLNMSSPNNPVQSILSVLGRLQDSIVADMGERSDPVGIDGLVEESNPETV